MITQETFLMFLLRVILGILFLFQGYDKVFKIKIAGVIQFFTEEMRGRNMPSFLITLAAFYTSVVELTGGILLVLGLFKTWALYFLGFDLIMVCIAFSYLKPMWDMQLVLPRLVILSALLLLPESWDTLSLDHLLWPVIR